MKTFVLDTSQYTPESGDNPRHRQYDGLEAVGKLMAFLRGEKIAYMPVPSMGEERSIRVATNFEDRTPDRVIDEVSIVAQALFNRVARGDGELEALVQEHCQRLDAALRAMPGPDEEQSA